jgi:dTDP-4-dehydrorhamnose 3,5-epimerase
MTVPGGGSTVVKDIHVRPASIPDVLVIEPGVHADNRGLFFESYRKENLSRRGIDVEFVQDNHSRSRRGVVRGLHYQAPPSAQWRLVRCTVGTVLDVVVDLRVGSRWAGNWVAIPLTAESRRQLLVPPAFAHGFAVLSEFAEVQYKCSAYHDPEAERVLAWNDPDLAIPWPVGPAPRVSSKDASARSWRDYLAAPDFVGRRQPALTGLDPRGTA